MTSQHVNEEGSLYRDLFKKLYNNVKEGDNEMWQPFNKDKFTLEPEFTEKYFTENQRQFWTTSTANGDVDRVLISKLLENASLFDENFWLKLILATRDKACKPVDRGKKARVRLQGHADHEVTLADLEKRLLEVTLEDQTNHEITKDGIERRLLEDLPDLFQSQLCVPEVITFDQDKDDLVRKLKQQYDKVNNSKESKKLKKERIDAIKTSHYAQCLQKHVADEAEAVVQTKIYEAARIMKVPMVVLRGIKTAEHIGRHLERFGITLTKLKSLLSPENSKDRSDEVEHDVLLLAYHNNSVHVTFLQVRTLWVF